MEQFVQTIVDVFDLRADPADLRCDPMAGSSQRLWKLTSGHDCFVVKEFPYDSPSDIVRREAAARFEREVFTSRALAMPEPIPSADGAFVVPATGSRGERCAIRLHRWFDGAPVRSPSPDRCRDAGTSLGSIQRAGAVWSARPTGDLRWWEVEPDEVLDRLARSALVGLAARATSPIHDALELVELAESLDGDWVFTHCDHKPENSMLAGNLVAVLDWDECGHCHPELEAIEAALRWSDPARPGRQHFSAFLDGYREAGGMILEGSERSFGKWIAALTGWFCFQSRRAIGEWPADSAAERHDAEQMADEAIAGLEFALDNVATWALWT